MFPYWLLFTVFAAGAIQSVPAHGRRLQGGPLFLVAGFATALMIGLRYQVGGDWFNYLGTFNRIQIFGFYGSGQDPAYAFLNWLAAQMGVGIWFVNLVCAALFTWGLMKFARREPNPWLVILVAVPYLIIVVAMGYTRQAVALGLLLAALTAFQDKSLTRFLVYMVAAAAFHKSVIIVLPIIMLTTTRNRFVTGVILSVSALIIYYVFVQAATEALITNYVQAEYASQGAGVRVAMNLPPALIYLLFQKRFQLDNERASLWRNFALASLATFLVLMFTEATTAVDRVALYLIPLQMFVLARLPEIFPSRGKANLGLVLGIVAYSALIQFVWLNYAYHSFAWKPYRLYPLAHEG